MWDVPALEQRLKHDFALDLPLEKWLEEDNHFDEDALRQRVLDAAIEEYKQKESIVGEQTMRSFEKGVMLQTLDELWKEHLSAMDYFTSWYPFAWLCTKRSKTGIQKRMFPNVYGYA